MTSLCRCFSMQLEERQEIFLNVLAYPNTIPEPESKCGILTCDECAVISGLTSDRKGSIKRSLADSLSPTSAIHLSIKALTSGSVTFAKDAGLIPYQNNTTKICKYIQ